jgi:NADP-dependent 3-hydroxy acid dehydrogenase YdfG
LFAKHSPPSRPPPVSTEDDARPLAFTEFAGRVAVVTGAASGIGRAYAQHLGRLGMHVVLADIEREPLDAATHEVVGAASVMPIVTDVADEASVRDLAAAVFAEHGKVHLLCNNAGVSLTRSLLEATTDDWRWLLGVNVWGVIHGITAFVPTMVERGEPGHVVNTASIASWTVVPGYGMYAASKHAVAAISDALAGDLAAVGAPIGVTAVCPSLVRTRLFSSERNRDGGAADTEEQRRIDAVNEGIQTPEDIAASMVEGVRRGDAWVFPNRERLDFVRERYARILG